MSDDLIARLTDGERWDGDNAAVLVSLADEVVRLREALGAVAGQKLAREMDEEMYDSADFEGGYEALVENARAALAGEQGDNHE
jgi:hypothetical protein